MQDSERVGRYQLLEPIGAGPNGVVARAKVFGVAGFERQFAIKRFLPELTASPSAAQSLSAAARSYGSLEHPRIARMSEFGVAQGQTFTAVELVTGLDAMRLVAESKLGSSGLPAGGALALISQAARAVGYAHGRGLSHLGLSPTNVIVTADGDVKVTDFGILAATITARPVDTPRIAQRIGYLAPEQLVGETTSAATDVFVLGVIAYELVTGQRAFYGETPQALAQAILAGPPADPSLPRPIVRVLSRCLARSQFERFPDARAFADALDAALRVAPVPGTRKDVGAQVKSVVERHAAMNDGMLSGVVALNVGAFRPPELISAQTLPARSLPPQAPRESAEGISTTEFVRPDVPVGRPAPLVGPLVGPLGGVDVSPASTMPEIPKTMTTVPGLVVPPPIPVPPGISALQPSMRPVPGGASTMLGLPGAKKPQVPSVIAQIKPKPNPRAPTSNPVGPPVRAGMAPAATTPGIGGATAPSLPGRRGATGSDAPRIDSVLGLGAEPDPELGIELDLERDEIVDTHRDAQRYTTGPAGQPVASPPGSQLSDDPPTVPNDVGPAVPTRGGLQPFAPARNVPGRGLDTAPSIEVIREPLLQAPARVETDALVDAAFREPRAPSGRQQPITSPPFQRELPTGEMHPDLVRDLKRASQSTSGERAAVVPPFDDPLVEMSLEVHGGERLELPSIAPSVRPASAASNGPGKPNPTPPPMRPVDPVDRMPSPTPPSLVAPEDPAFDDTQLGPGAGQTLIGAAGANQLGSNPHGPQHVPPVPLHVPQGLPPGGFGPNGPLQPTAGAGAFGPGPLGGGYPAPGGGQPNYAPPGLAPPAFSLPSQHRAKRRWPLILILLAVVGAGVGVFVWQMMEAGKADGTKLASSDGSAKGSAISNGGSGKTGSATSGTGSGRSATSGSGTGSGTTGSGTSGGSATNGSNTGSGTKPGIGSGSGKEVIQPTGASDSLQIASTPIGARVFIDGADQGVTPVKLPGSADRHTMALLLAGHELYVAEVDGHGSFQIPLKAVTPNGGGAGIKVIKCKDKDRYYVFVDGKPTGMTCPTERIECEVGSHTVEVYDLVTENRRKWDIKVTDTRLSYRVKVD